MVKNKFRVKVTPEVKKQMVEMRKKGLTYAEIGKKFNIGKGCCITHLKSLKVNKDVSWIEKEWEKAEREAEKILKDYNFSHIVNLNQICQTNPYWDYYCERNKERWLIDVTINEKKDAIDKFSRGLKGYKTAILLKEENGWKFFELKLEKLKK